MNTTVQKCSGEVKQTQEKFVLKFHNMPTIKICFAENFFAYSKKMRARRGLTIIV